ncbi:MAG: hypothetical protein AAF789_08020 [Bacteroidota bacterium]
MKTIGSFLLVFLCLKGYTQINTQIYVDEIGAGGKTFTDTLKLKNAITSKLQEFSFQGYVFCGIDSMVYRNDSTFIYLHRGKRFELQQSENEKSISMRHINRQLTDLTENGYPFSQIIRTVDTISGDKALLSVTVEKGPKIIYDSAQFLNPIKTKKSYIYQLLDIKPNSAFNESGYQNLEDLMQRSQFLGFQKAPDVSFKNGKATTFLDIEEKTANSFQGILGLQEANDGGTRFIGSLDLALANLFNTGKELEFAIESFAEQSQNLELRYKHPFLLGSNLSPFFSFNFLKQDTSFLTRELAAGFETFISKKVSVSIEFREYNASLLTSNEVFANQQGLADFRRRSYGIRLQDGVKEIKEIGSSAGWAISVSYGTKQIQRNTSLSDSFYDTLDLNTDLFQASGHFTLQQKLGKRLYLNSTSVFGLLENDEILQNDLYRIGGLSDFRGFNENSFFARRFWINRIELRNYTSRYSYFFLFYDQMILKSIQDIDYPFGTGGGFVLETNAGLFNFALAMGKSSDQAFSAQQIRVHFGYTSLF